MDKQIDAFCKLVDKRVSREIKARKTYTGPSPDTFIVQGVGTVTDIDPEKTKMKELIDGQRTDWMGK